MNQTFYNIARRLWPQLESMSEQRRLVGIGDVIIFLFAMPLAITGLIWLVSITDLEQVRSQWAGLLLFGGLIYLFNRVNYFFIIEIRADRYGSAEGSLASMLQWAAVFLFGANSLWLSIAGTTFSYVNSWRRPASRAARWNQIRAFAIDLATGTLAYLVALAFYHYIGGQLPLGGLSFSKLLPPMGAFVIHFLMVTLIWIGYTGYAIWVQRVLTHSASIEPILKFFFLALGLPVLAHPFAILVAGLYEDYGVLISMFFVSGMLMVAYLSRQLSWAAETSRQQSRQLEKLEQLNRDIITSPLDASTLSSLLEKHVPTMFSSGRVVVWLAPDQYLLRHPVEWAPDIEPIWNWVKERKTVQAFMVRSDLPWDPAGSPHDPVILTPILDVNENQPIGCVLIELRSLAQPWDWKALTNLYPAVLSLAASVASALHQAVMYAESLEYQTTLQELEFAGRIQASFLPNEMPDMDGWELAVTLLPARETSGDFFDFIQISEHQVGIMIADVADKGVGAALYMALSRTLIRTYALEYDAQPDIVLFSANERILQDASANLFVTAFYGVLDIRDGTLTYANAGHNAPFILSPKNGGSIHALTATGMPLGIDEDASWTQATVKIEPGDTLVLYTDGIPDALNPEGIFFKERRLMEVAFNQMGNSAQEIQTTILNTVQEFVGGAAQFDDITLLVILRDPQPEVLNAADPLADNMEPPPGE